MEYMQVLKTVFALREVPELMISDNGSQLVGTERELRNMIEGLDTEKLKSSLLKKEWSGSSQHRPLPTRMVVWKL